MQAAQMLMQCEINFNIRCWAQYTNLNNLVKMARVSCNFSQQPARFGDKNQECIGFNADRVNMIASRKRWERMFNKFVRIDVGGFHSQVLKLL
jgi:hypothetical protein